MLKPGGGRLHLFDVVFPAEMPDYECRFNAWLESMKNRIGLDFAEEGGTTHIRDEYSTYDWVIEGMLARAGFHIEEAQYGDSFDAAYLCRNPDRS